MNNPVKSKINFVSIVMLVVTIAGIWGFIDEELKTKVYETILLVGPLLTIIFRTWFTVPAWFKKLEAEIEKVNSDVDNPYDYS